MLPSQSTSNSGLVGVIAVSDSDHAAVVDCILESIENEGHSKALMYRASKWNRDSRS